MPFDGFVMKIVVEEIKESVLGQNVRNIYLYDKVIYFSFDKGDLKISLNPNYSHISFTDHLVKEPDKHTFVELLRSRIRGGKVTELTTNGYERTMVMKLRKFDEIGERHEYEIYFDIMGKHSNAVLVENGLIVDAYKRIETRVRKIFPGEPFILFPSEKLRIDEVTLERLSDALYRFQNKQRMISEFIYSTIQGFSKQTAEELLFRSEVEDKPLSLVDRSDLENLVEGLSSISEEISQKVIYIYYENEQPADISAFRLHKYNDLKRCENVVSCINEYFDFVEKKDKLIQKRTQLLTIVNNRISSLEDVLTQIEKEREECLESDKYRKYGELIKAYSYQIPHGVDSVELFDWETNQNVMVPLEPHLSPIENSVKYFKIYNKLKKKLEGLSEREIVLKRELEYLKQLQDTVENAETLEELEEIEEEMIENDLIKKTHKRKIGKSKSEKSRSEPRKYMYKGFTILVGRNNKQNDELVRKSSEHDIWLHVQGMPGAHVVIKTNGKPVDEDVLLYAAKLAAQFSKGKYSTKVPVDYTYIKYVKKPKGFKPGLVLYSNFKTLFVTPDEKYQ
ncbi:putative RNA-binding protein, snRNP like protein [Fervidobacterium pennivorans DSM 9078]|jgi:predicted ribosome quality control (RQC) complex YloA/Tae2 family protein|uniref:Rqc2 homolog RqcH n=1 Tax=Fervidobacterium pennivorans (strain DSM 9078 / Ven5) TaxID=771875 RepID=H9UBP6_FERPD|nr:NFACT family protein [Fervidobacterium pennivorans]AFG34939.1 putative RNA-binding protein, snRNP like protein [Fervidobacterium pennivorans DSM 9078]QIV78158.1 fibronectin-binding domain-containing protein [Fervidobacterium pennivorans subsp. keratinolyticus]